MGVVWVARGNIQQISYIPQTEQHSSLGLMLLRLGNVTTMCMCVCMCMHVCVHMWVHVCVCMCACVCVHVCVHVCACVFVGCCLATKSLNLNNIK